MDVGSGRLTVFFEDPFWVGVFECVSDRHLSVCKVTFGAEPKECDVLEFVLDHYYELKFSPAVETEVKRGADNPKRRQRNVRKELQVSGIGTRSQQAFKVQQALDLQREEAKIERRRKSREQREAEKQRQFELKQQKRKEKHRGH